MLPYFRSYLEQIKNTPLWHILNLDRHVFGQIIQTVQRILDEKGKNIITIYEWRHGVIASNAASWQEGSGFKSQQDFLPGHVWGTQPKTRM